MAIKQVRLNSAKKKKNSKKMIDKGQCVCSTPQLQITDTKDGQASASSHTYS